MTLSCFVALHLPVSEIAKCLIALGCLLELHCLLFTFLHVCPYRNAWPALLLFYNVFYIVYMLVSSEL